MRLTAHQPAYMPWLGLLHKIASADQFCLFDSVPMESSGFENRNYILTTNGRLLLTVPVKRSQDTPIHEVQIADDQPWQRKHWRSIELAYSKAPYWDKYASLLRWIYLGMKWHSLAELNKTILRELMTAFAIWRPMVELHTMVVEGKKDELVLSMCKKLGATEYIFGEMGRQYANPQMFKNAGITPLVQIYSPHPIYPQLPEGQAFVPNVWAFDLLLNMGPDEGKKILMKCGRIEAF